MAKDRDPETRKLIARLQREEDKALADRRRRLTNGLSRALLHLNPTEMDALETIIHGAVGRSVCAR